MNQNEANKRLTAIHTGRKDGTLSVDEAFDQLLQLVMDIKESEQS